MDDFFKNKKINFKKLQNFGFQSSDNNFIYSKEIAGGQLKLNITVSNTGSVSTSTVDTATLEPYTLHLDPAASGKYVGKVREEYENLLNKISLECFDRDVFKSACIKSILEYAKEKYNDEPEFLWEKFDTNAVLRRKDSNKWYAVIMIVPKNKITGKSKEEVEVIDLRGSVEDVEKMADNKRFFPGYHMNKKHWYTIIADNAPEKGKLFELVDKSYNLAIK